MLPPNSNTLWHWSYKLNCNLPNIRALASKNNKFSWNKTHQKEFKTVKKQASKVDFLSPYDPKKPIYLQTDGSKSNLRYLLFQDGDEETAQTTEGESEETKRKKPHRRRIVSMGATDLTPGQRNWYIFEVELLAVCWALNHA